MLVEAGKESEEEDPKNLIKSIPIQSKIFAARLLSLSQQHSLDNTGSAAVLGIGGSNSTGD